MLLWVLLRCRLSDTRPEFVRGCVQLYAAKLREGEVARAALAVVLQGVGCGESCGMRWRHIV